MALPFNAEIACVSFREHPVHWVPGCAGRDKGKTPPVITVQVTDNSPREPGNFSMEVSALNPGAEAALEFATKRLIDDYTGHKSSLRVL
jgi:hypothetical protein